MSKFFSYQLATKNIYFSSQNFPVANLQQNISFIYSQTKGEPLLNHRGLPTWVPDEIGMPSVNTGISCNFVASRLGS